MNSLISIQRLKWVRNKMFSALLKQVLILFHLTCSRILR
jgi:hypothetical protein